MSVDFASYVLLAADFESRWLGDLAKTCWVCVREAVSGCQHKQDNFPRGHQKWGFGLSVIVLARSSSSLHSLSFFTYIYIYIYIYMYIRFFVAFSLSLSLALYLCLGTPIYFKRYSLTFSCWSRTTCRVRLVGVSYPGLGDRVSSRVAESMSNNFNSWCTGDEAYGELAPRTQWKLCTLKSFNLLLNMWYVIWEHN